MQNLAQKYRPHKLEDITEQGIVVDIVNNICSADVITHRNFLFVGPAGCGKTTIGKIIASKLNEGASSSDGNLIEIDAASHNGVDSMREIISQARSYPVGAKYKVFIIDECHALSSASWQAALLTIEEQPAMSVFIWCVTGDGLVPTNSGLKRMDSILVGDQVWDGDQFRYVDNVFDNGERHCLRLTLKDGSSLTCTDDHQIEVLQGDSLVWKKAKDITLHDHILVYNNYSSSSESCNLSVEEAWMLGYITGNGNYTSHSLDLYTPFHKWDKVQTCLDALISQKIIKDYIVDSDERALNNHIHDTRIHFYSDKYHAGMSQWYMKTGLDPNYTRGTKKIPSCMYSASSALIRAFVEGWYYADGDGQHPSFFEPNPDTSISRPCIYCSNHDMILSLQQLLRVAGLYSAIYSQSTVITEDYYQVNDFIKPGTYQSYSLSLLSKPGYFDDELFRSILLNKYNDMPRGKYLLDLSDLKNPLRRISPKMIEEAGYDYSSKGRFMDVTCIEDAGVQHVYDIEVRDSHKFVYNGVVVHNCTTNPEKIPATILSRVQTFQLSKISLNGIFSRLKYIIEQENSEGRNITYDDDAVLYISKIAGGGMRDAITLLEKALSFSNHITMDSLQTSLGLPNYDDYFALLNAYAKKNNEAIIEIVDRVYNSGVNFVKWFDGFFAFVTNIVKYIYMKDINATMIPSTYQDKIQGYSAVYAALCLKLSNMLSKMIQDLKGTQYLQEVAISYLCTPQTLQKGQ